MTFYIYKKAWIVWEAPWKLGKQVQIFLMSKSDLNNCEVTWLSSQFLLWRGFWPGDLLHKTLGWIDLDRFDEQSCGSLQENHPIWSENCHVHYSLVKDFNFFLHSCVIHFHLLRECYTCKIHITLFFQMQLVSWMI